MARKVAIVYHYLALYRLPIFRQLMKSKSLHFRIIAGLDSDIEIKKIDYTEVNLPLQAGGLRWSLVKNRWFLKNKLLWQQGLLRYIMESDDDVFIFLGSPYHISTWFALILARLKGKKVYFWMHGLTQDSLGGVGFFKIYVFYKLAHGFFLYGNRAKRNLISRRIKKAEDIHVIYNSLNYEASRTIRKNLTIEDYRAFRQEHFGNKDLPVIIFIGRLNAIKRIDLLIEVQKMLCDQHGNVTFNLLVIGDGDQKDNLMRLTEIYGLRRNVKFMGAIYDEALNANYLMYSDLCVTPGEVGLTAIHALSYGTPVISHNNLNIQMPEVEAVIEGKTGALYEYESADALSKCIEDWLKKYPVKTIPIVENCWNVIDQFYNPEYQAKIFEETLVK